MLAALIAPSKTIETDRPVVRSTSVTIWFMLRKAVRLLGASGLRPK